MGQEESRMVDERTPTDTLTARSIDAVAEYILSEKCQRIVVMVGAGISTSAGIPDFRSPETGLYANLQRLNLPFAEAVFDISFFRQNPLPFYTLAHELYPGKYRPTITHSFLRLLFAKRRLLKVFTQNIDCLEREAGLPDDLIIEAHGSFARQSCIECHASFPDADMKEAIESKTVPLCPKSGCHGFVKPNIVFFGEALPPAFFQNRSLPAAADLCLVMGTSLTVQPFASLPQMAGEGVPRVLINKEPVGGLGSRADDVLVLGDCDEGVRKLARALGWLEELEALWEATSPEPAHERRERERRESVAKANQTEMERLQDQVDKLTEEVDQSLKISKDHTDWVKGGLDADAKRETKEEKAEAPADASEKKADARDTSPSQPGPASASKTPEVAAEPITEKTPSTAAEPKAEKSEGDNKAEAEGLRHVFVHKDDKDKPSL